MKLLNIPNIITLGNLTSGCLAIFTAFSAQIDNASKIKLIAFFVLVSLILDFMDGMLARALKIKSDLGKELDSLADVVSFGVVPTCILLLLFGKIDFSCACSNFFSFKFSYELISIAVALFSALRLAKFNLDVSQTKYFKGLATPANTIFILSVAMTHFLQPNFELSHYFVHPIFLILLILISCFLLISNIPMFSFKITQFSFSENYFRYIFLIGTIILIVIFQYAGLFFSIIGYVVISIIFRNKITNQ